MKINNILLPILLLISTLTASAQVPGFMGKRALLMLDFNPAPALLNMNVNHKVTADITGEARAAATNPFAFNIRPQLSFEYLLGKSIAMGMNLQQVVTGTIIDEDAMTTYGGYGVLKGNAAGISLKFYKFRKGGAVAPLGLYSSLNLDMYKINAYSSLRNKTKLLQEDINYPVASWGFGKQFMPVPRLLVGTGAEIGLAFISIDENESTASLYTREAVEMSTFAYHLFNFKVSVGYMLF